MKIKKGDKVRVSKDAPEMYIYPDSPGDRDCECIVKDTDGDNAYIEPKEFGYFPFTSIIPTKYLVKVDAEAKVKCGDAVLAMKTDQISPSSKAVTFRRNVSIVTKIKDGIASLLFIDKYGENHHARTAVEFLQKVDSEPAEHTEAKEAPCVGRINFAERMKRQQEAHHAIVDEFSSRSFDWDTYTADLVKEIALKVANRYNNPEETADYAAKAAKQIVKRLKENK